MLHDRSLEKTFYRSRDRTHFKEKKTEAHPMGVCLLLDIKTWADCVTDFGYVR